MNEIISNADPQWPGVLLEESPKQKKEVCFFYIR